MENLENENKSIEELSEDSGIELKPKKEYKRTKPFVQSEKQKEIWEKALQKRRENSEMRKKLKEEEEAKRKQELEKR
jgi:hypothetical protein